MASNQIIPLDREIEVGARITGNPDGRPRPSVATDTQVRRLGGTMEAAFRNILDRDDIKVADDPSALAPERALVLEIIGTPTSFVKAAEKAGLEWLAEEAATLYGVSDYLNQGRAESEQTITDEFDDILGGDVEPEDEGTVGRLYLGMPTVASFARLRDYWTAYASGESAPYGMGIWWDLFSHLHRIRPWGAEDRVGEATRMRLSAERARRPGDELQIEVDLWYRVDSIRRDQILNEFRTTVASVGGVILDELRIEEIRYHSALLRLPAAAIDAIVALAGPLAVADEVMSIRPQSSFRFGLDEVVASEEVDDVQVAPAEGASIAAVIDGWPVANHTLLRDRLDIIELDVADSLAPVNTRYHGTAMASLILRGDHHAEEQPISRRLKMVPVLAPDGAGYESPPADKLALKLIYRAVKALKEGTDGQEPSGPDVVIINHSICDEAFGFTGTVSPWARLLDYLSWKYKVLFVVSAGNVKEPFELPQYADDIAMRAATPEHRRNATLIAVDAAKSQRSMLTPAEAVNALTVAASHEDGSDAVLPSNLADPFGDFSVPNLNSGLGLGFNRSIKPDLMLPGGRQVAHPTLGTTLRIRGFESPAFFGQKVASPDPHGGSTKLTRRSSGTSNAAALATRAGLLIGDVLDVSPQPGATPWYRRATAPCVLKALVAHGARWGNAGETMTGIHAAAGSLARRKEAVARAIGYGRVDHELVVSSKRTRVTLLGQDTIKAGRRHSWKIPLPDELSSSAEFRRIVLTLAWLTPIRPNSSNYRLIGLDLVDGEGLSHLWEGASRSSYQPAIEASRRGTLIHAVYEGKRAVPFDDDGNFVVNVQAMSKLTKVKGYDVPYALAVTIEVADTISTDIGTSIRRKIDLRNQTRAQERTRSR
jgi:hypothetical protein